MRSRKPKWYERNEMARAGIDPNKWRILESNREYMRVVQKKTGKVREIDLGGKMVRRSSDHDVVAERLARSLKTRREK